MRNPELVLVVGPCGAGKTTWARATYPEHIHPDAETLSRTLFADPDSFRYHPWVRVAGQRLLACAVEVLLPRGIPVCVTARGATRRERQQWIDTAARHHIPVHVVRLVVDADTCVARACADSSRPRSSRAAWRPIVNRWFNDFEPVDPGDVASYQEVTVAGQFRQLPGVSS